MGETANDEIMNESGRNEPEMTKLSEEDLKSASGGSTPEEVKYYRMYANVYYSVKDRSLKTGHGQARCPKCGMHLQAWYHVIHYGLEVWKCAESNQLYCSACRHSYPTDDWLINAYNRN
ncbi:MAG: hypothetical protein IKS32_01550 [Solobacterium sp.]|nr:hypothetical protein [Solobacterium sp.]